MKIINRLEIPASMIVHGRTGGPTVTVNDNGQCHLSKQATEFLNGAKHVGFGFDGLGAFIVPKGHKLTKGVPDDGLCAVNYPKSKNSSGCSFSAAVLFRLAKENGASVTYDYKGSGNQTFTAELDGKNGWIKFELPESGSLTKKVVAPRKKKAAPANTVTAGNGATATTEPVELQLQ